MSHRFPRPSTLARIVALGVVGGSMWAAAADAGAANLRAYELVSPADKGGQAVFLSPRSANAGIIRPSLDGDAAVFVSWGNFADARGGMPLSYRARRTPSGWESEAVTPPPAGPDPDAVSGQYVNTWVEGARDLSTGFAYTADPLDPLDLNETHDVYEIGAGGSATLISRGNGDVHVNLGKQVRFGGAGGTLSPDGKHVIFSSDAHLVDADSGRAAGLDLYERYDGRTYLVNQTDAGWAVLNRCGSKFADTNRHAISDDGERVIFQSPFGGGADPDCTVPSEVYMRAGRERTIHISASQRSLGPDPSGARPKTYVGASADGDVVFFTSNEELTDRPGRGLYRYTVPSGRLDLIVSGNIPKVSKVSADGTTVYFISIDALAPGAVARRRNLYYLHGDGPPRLIVTDLFGITLETAVAQTVESGRQVNVTPDGRHYVFVTRARLDSIFDNRGRFEAYLYDANSSRLTCISCDPAGQRLPNSEPMSDASIKSDLGITDDQAPAISADGSTVVFDTADQLVADDVNSRRDVYQYSDGRLSLVTTGRDVNDSTLIGMAADGRDVFFATSASLVSSDVDGGNVDIYDARIGGGFPDAIGPVEQSCDGDGCQGPAYVAPIFGAAGTETFSGDGQVDEDVPLLVSNSLSVRRVTRAQKRRFARTSRLGLRVRVRGGGTLRVRGTSKVRGHVRSVARGAKRVRTRGRVATRVVVRLNPIGRRMLKRRGRLRVKLTIGFSGVSHQRTMSFTLTRKRT